MTDVASRELRNNTRALFDPVPVDPRVAEAGAHLFVAFRRMDRRVPVNDSWSAATAIALGVAVVTQDRDYSDVPGLTVVGV